MVEFLFPKSFFLLLILVPIILFRFFYENKRKIRLPFTCINTLKQVSRESYFLKYLPFIFRIISIIFLIIAISRPRIVHQKKEVVGKGIDIIFAVDVSGSMKAIDFKPTNRLEAAKNVALDFINKRKKDRIGLVTFSDNAFTAAPITLDYNLLSNILKNVQIDEESQGTGIGIGLATAIGRIYKSSSKSKIIILLTDGRNNTGDVEPQMAAELASTFGIKVYPIGIGGDGEVDYPYKHPILGLVYQKVKIDIDMNTLDKIAKITKTGSARRAIDTKQLESILEEIDELEKTEYKINNYYEYEEKFWIFLLITFFFLFLELLFRVNFFINFP